MKEEFPRIPFPKNEGLIIKIADLGKRIAKYHLLTSKSIDSTTFPMSASIDYKIYNIRRNDRNAYGIQLVDTYDPETQKIYFKKRTSAQIKAEQSGDNLEEITWIGCITQEMWDFEIGGRKQLKEWLYDRRYFKEVKKNTIQRAINNGELEYFLKMCDAKLNKIESDLMLIAYNQETLKKNRFIYFIKIQIFFLT